MVIDREIFKEQYENIYNVLDFEYDVYVDISRRELLEIYSKSILDGENPIVIIPNNRLDELIKIIMDTYEIEKGELIEFRKLLLDGIDDIDIETYLVENGDFNVKNYKKIEKNINLGYDKIDYESEFLDSHYEEVILGKLPTDATWEIPI